VFLDDAFGVVIDIFQGRAQGSELATFVTIWRLEDV
jgi:hypothetical protein